MPLGGPGGPLHPGGGGRIPGGGGMPGGGGIPGGGGMPGGGGPGGIPEKRQTLVRHNTLSAKLPLPFEKQALIHKWETTTICTTNCVLFT